MSPTICEPLPSNLFPAVSARVLKEGLGVISVTLVVALLLLGATSVAAPEIFWGASFGLPGIEAHLPLVP